LIFQDKQYQDLDNLKKMKLKILCIKDI
jgi:hypothetical protein